MTTHRGPRDLSLCIRYAIMGAAALAAALVALPAAHAGSSEEGLGQGEKVSQGQDEKVSQGQDEKVSQGKREEVSEGEGEEACEGHDERAAQYEIGFMQSMIEHHRSAVMMAELCLDRAEHAKLRGLCQDILDAQQGEIAKMERWLGGWYDVEHVEQGRMEHGQAMIELSTLKGAQFDAAFLQEMTQHHESAVKDARECQQAAGHDELVSLCGNIATGQLEEIGQMGAWYQRWFGSKSR